MRLRKLLATRRAALSERQLEEDCEVGTAKAPTASVAMARKVERMLKVEVVRRMSMLMNVLQV